MSSVVNAAITFGQLDDFQAGTTAKDTMDWFEGVASPNPPLNIETGGPRGDGDRFLRNLSSGGPGAGSKQVMFNEKQWAGNYTAAGVTRIDASVANLGATPLYLRVALTSLSGAQFSSAQAVVLPADGVWRRVSFDLTESALARIGGTQALVDALSNVTTLRLLSAEAGPSNFGDSVEATLGADDIRALRLPGDANFDGRVDSADYRIARLGLGNPGAGADWAHGDFDFDGRVTARDVVLLRRNLGGSIGAGPGAGLASAQSVGFLSVASAPLPEPAGMAVIGLVSCPLLLRRRTLA